MIIKISFVINLIQRRTLLCFANFVRLRSGCCWTFFFTKGSSDHAWRQAHYLSSHHSATTSRGALVKKENKSIKSFAILELPQLTSEALFYRVFSICKGSPGSSCVTFQLNATSTFPCYYLLCLKKWLCSCARTKNRTAGRGIYRPPVPAGGGGWVTELINKGKRQTTPVLTIAVQRSNQSYWAALFCEAVYNF